MKLECLMLWAERFLFAGQDGTEKGLIGWLKGSFIEDDRIVFTEMSGEADNRVRNEWEELCIFLSGERAEYMLRTLADLNVVIFNKDSGSEQDEVYNGNPFVYNGYNTVIKITIPAGSDWNGVLCFRLYCAKFNDGAADNSAKVSLCFDNISIAEAA